MNANALTKRVQNNASGVGNDRLWVSGWHRLYGSDTAKSTECNGEKEDQN